MFDRSDYFDYEHDEDEVFKSHSVWRRGMNLWTWVGVALVALVLFVVLVRCCRRNANGRVLAPPPQSTSAAVPYPQQQFVAAPAHYPAPPVGVQMVGSTYPGGAYYPHGAAGGAGGAGGAGYYAGGDPVLPAHYPGGDPVLPAHYPMPHPALPTAPDVNACPPSYSQVMGEKQPPFNPNVPH